MGGFLLPEPTMRFAAGFSRSSVCLDCLAGTYGNSSGSLLGLRIEVAFQDLSVEVAFQVLWSCGHGGEGHCVVKQTRNIFEN